MTQLARRRMVLALGTCLLAGVAAVAVLVVSAGARPAGRAAGDAVAQRAVGRAHCGPGSRPEPALQGEVPLADRRSGRSVRGYSCNLRRIGHYRGGGASWVNPTYGHCDYMSSRFPSGSKAQGVRVVDVSDPRHPRSTATLTSPAMLGTWESLKVNQRRGLLAGVSAPGPAGNGLAGFAVYDVKSDCAHPKLLSSEFLPTFGHEGSFSPDGRTYWASGLPAGVLTAIDISDPTKPHILFSGPTGVISHGFGVSDDGNRLYLAEVGNLGKSFTGQGLDLPDVEPNGLKIFDVSEIQSRKAMPRIHELGHVYWSDGGAGQHAIPITSHGHRYVVFVDELNEGGARIIDVSDPRNPRIVSRIKLQIQLPRHAAQRKADLAGNGLFGYEAHYCAVDREHDPAALACGEFQSGIRVFDIRRLTRPREIAYYNPPAQTGQSAHLPRSEHAQSVLGDIDVGGNLHGPANLTADWCSSPPAFVGRDQLWATCQDGGFMALRFTNHAYPLNRRRARAH